MLLASSAFAQEPKTQTQIKLYGFVRTYFTYDSRENVSGTEDLFNYLPKDNKISDGVDLNQISSFRFASLTSRLGVDVTGYQVNGWNIAAKIEADFYSGVTGVTGTAALRLRQAYMTMGKDALTLKIGQAWHPLAADFPDIISLNNGAPFNPFSRTPMVLADYNLSNGFSLTGAALWQMQYTSAGPSGASANYIKYSCVPEMYFGLNFKQGGFTGRMGADLLSIKPRNYDASGKYKVNDRITTVNTFVYAQYVNGMFTAKAKAVFARAGEHLNLNGGYAATGYFSDGTISYTPTLNYSAWFSVIYGKKLQGALFGGYVKNFGTEEAILSPDLLYFSKNSFSNMNKMLRLTPTILYNMGKVTFALEYEVTSVQYGSWSADTKYGLATDNLHWVTNNRVQAMLKYSF